MQVTSASPLPRVEMVAVKGLKSQRARPHRCIASEARRRRSSAANSLHMGMVPEFQSYRALCRVQASNEAQASRSSCRQLAHPVPPVAAAAAAPHQAASRSAPQNSSLPQTLCTVTLGSRAAASSGV